MSDEKACSACGTDAALCRKRIAAVDSECCSTCIKSAGRTHMTPADGGGSPGITTPDDPSLNSPSAGPAPMAAPDAEGLANWLSNEGDGGIWESLDRANSNVVADAMMRSSWLADHDAAVRAEHGERIAQAIEAKCAAEDHDAWVCKCDEAATLARETGRNDG